MASLDWLYAALLSVGGSILGGLVVGWYALRAVHQEWEHERATSRLDRSRQAALAIIVAISELERAIVAWQKGREDADALREVHNSSDITIVVQSTALMDDDLSECVENHRSLLWKLDVATHHQDEMARTLSETVRYHADAVILALRAHARDESLPSYQAPPLDDPARLLTWGRHPEGGG